jgi:hypothetical protein
MITIFCDFNHEILRSIFSAVFANFRQKISVSLKNQCFDQNFSKKLSVV